MKKNQEGSRLLYIKLMIMISNEKNNYLLKDKKYNSNVLPSSLLFVCT